MWIRDSTLIIHNEDTPGCIAEVTMSLALRRINIASMQVFRAAVGRYAVMVLECDSHIPHTLEQQLAVMPGDVYKRPLRARVRPFRADAGRQNALRGGKETRMRPKRARASQPCAP